MKSDILKYTNEIPKLVASMQILFSEEGKKNFTEMAEDDFEYLDLENLSQETEQQLKNLYEISLVVLSFDMFPEHIKAAYTNIKKRLYPLFEDTTTYLTQEPNNSILLNSINQYESGKAREVSFL